MPWSEMTEWVCINSFKTKKRRLVDLINGKVWVQKQVVLNILGCMNIWIVLFDEVRICSHAGFVLFTWWFFLRILPRGFESPCLQATIWGEYLCNFFGHPHRRAANRSLSSDMSDERRVTPQKSNIDTKNGHIQKEPPFPNHHFGYPAVSFWGCRYH